jgi:hypothetical protein
MGVSTRTNISIRAIEMSEEANITRLVLGALAKATGDAKKAILSRDFVQACPRTCESLKNGMQTYPERSPRVYQEKYVKPFIDILDRAGELTVNYCLSQDGEDSDYAILAQPILQRCNCLEQVATDAFQEVVSDLYDGFVSEEIRADIKPLDHSVIAPLIAWIPSLVKTDDGFVPTGPCTLPADLLDSAFGIKTGLVYLPIQYAKQGLLLWATLSHETAGHDIIHADVGLLDELNRRVKEALLLEDLDPLLADYWTARLGDLDDIYRIDEAASDVMGILNIGPAAGIALIGVFRALNAAFDPAHKLKLSNIGVEDDEHPADILRAYLSAAVVRNLKFSKADDWAKYIEAEADSDLETIRLNANIDPTTGKLDPNSGIIIDPADAKRSAEVVAKIIAEGKMECLENHSLGEVQNWHDDDESIVNELKSNLTTLSPILDIYSRGIYAAHVVAAAVVAAVEEDADIELLFKSMVSILKLMHDANPVWSLPIYLEHPGDLGKRGSLRLSNMLYCGCR